MINKTFSLKVIIIIHKKTCKQINDCKITKIKSTLSQEIKLAILKKAAIIKSSERSEGQQNYSSTGPGTDRESKY